MGELLLVLWINFYSLFSFIFYLVTLVPWSKQKLSQSSCGFPQKMPLLRQFHCLCHALLSIWGLFVPVIICPTFSGPFLHNPHCRDTYVCYTFYYSAWGRRDHTNYPSLYHRKQYLLKKTVGWVQVPLKMVIALADCQKFLPQNDRSGCSFTFHSKNYIWFTL